MLQKVKDAARSIRYNDWWQTKVPFLFGIFLWHLGEFYTAPEAPFLNLLFVFMWIIGAAGFGYFVNDWFDIDQDKAAGKANMAASMHPSKRMALVAVLLLMAVLPWFYLPNDTVTLTLVGLHLLSFITYSVPPIRTKERYYLGSINDALYSFALPAIIVSRAAAGFSDVLLQVEFISLWLFMWAFAAGMRNITQHHILDRKEDAVSNTKNVVNKYGLRRNVNLIRLLWLPMELFFFLTYVAIWGRVPLIVYAGLLFYTFWGLLPVVRVNLRHRKYKFDLSLFSINGFYEHMLPMIMLAFWIVIDPWFLLVLVVWQVLIPNPIINFLLFQLEVLFHHVVLKLFWMVRLVLSRIVNYTIYFFILLFRFFKKQITGKSHEGGQ